MQRLLSRVRRCVEDFQMISPGDRIAVGVSGGKDSLALLWSLRALRRFYPVPFELEAITVDMGFGGMDFSAVAQFCRQLEVPYSVVPTNIAEIIFEVRKEKNPCALCAKMRRGCIHDAAIDRGCRKLALGHHFDDAVETFLMSLVYEGRLACFQPVTYLDRKDITVIRPMLYASDHMMRSAVTELSLPVVKSTCPADRHTKREEVKQLIATLSEQYPDLKSKVFGAMCRHPLKGWARETDRVLPELGAEE